MSNERYSDVSVDSAGQSTIRWGIVSTGTIAHQFAGDIGLAGGAALSAVCSRSAEQAAGFAAAHGGIAAYGSLDAFLQDDTVDAVYVASPNHTHLETARAALDAGKAVLVEKPLTASSAEAVRLTEHAWDRGLFLMEGMWTRFLPAVSHARQALASGRIGKVRRIRAELAFKPRYDPESRFFSPELGGGSLLDLGVYPISLALLLMGRPKSVRGSWRRAPTGVDMSATVDLAYDGCAVELSCAFDREGTNLFITEGERGTLILQPPFNGSRMVLETTPGLFSRLPLAGGHSRVARALRKLARVAPLPGIARHAFGFGGYGLQFEIEAASAAIAEGRQEHPLAPWSDTLETMRIIEAILAQPPVA